MSYSITSSAEDCYQGTTVLINRLGITEQAQLDDAEKIAVALHWVELDAQPVPLQMDFSYYCMLHRKLFGDLYEWAGVPRTIDISKKSTNFYPAAQIDHLGNALFRRLISENYFIDYPRTQFIVAIAEFYHSLNMLHPFREGNGRVQRLFFTLLVRRAGHELNLTANNADDLMLATIFAAQGVMDHLISFFDSAIQ